MAGPSLASLDPTGLRQIPNHSNLAPSESIDSDTRPFHELATFLPVADRASLVGLNDEEVRALSTSKADEYRRFALTMLSIYNAVAPIHRLPVEILSKIFEDCWRKRMSLRISHVCRRWRSILLNTSGFWATAVGHPDGRFAEKDHSTGYLGAMLERSAPRMIAPSFSRFSAHMSRCISPHAARVVSLVVSLADFSEFVDLWRCLNSGMPCLENLTIALIDNYSWAFIPPGLDENLHLLPAALPRLNRVTGPGSFLHCFAVPSLRDITLKSPGEGHPYNHRLESGEYLRNALAICASSLESLSLFDVVPSNSAAAGELSLPALDKLFMVEKTRPFAPTLPHLVLPDTTHIRIFVDNCDSFCDAVPLHNQAIQSALSRTDAVEILGVAFALMLNFFADSRELLSICLRDTDTPTRRSVLPPDDLVRFFGSKPGAPVTSLSVRYLDNESIDIEAIDLSAFPHLRQIHGTGPDVAFHILGELGRAADSQEDDAPSRAICPGLASLTLDSEFDLDSGPGCGADARDDGEGAEEEEPGAQWMESCLADVEDYFRELCAEAGRVLSQRAEMGEEWPELKLECRETWRLGRPGEPLWTAEIRDSELGGLIVVPIKAAVDGQVDLDGESVLPEHEGGL